MKIIAKDKVCFIRLEDKNSGNHYNCKSCLFSMDQYKSVASESQLIFWTYLMETEINIIIVFSGELFAQATVDTYPGVAVEAVTDSSRYFVVRIQDDTGKSLKVQCTTLTRQ